MVIRVLDGIQTRWSPDGKELVFTRMGDCSKGETDELRIISADGTNLRTVIHWGLDPRWSPDGSRILCSWIGKLALLNPKESYVDDDRKVRRLTDHSVLQGDFNWSPDGRMVAFVESSVESGKSFTGLYVVNADGTNLRCLIKDSSRRGCPWWSPDNQWLLCESSNGIEVFSVTSASRQLLSAHGIFPSWSPNGDKIAFYTYPGIYPFGYDERPTIPHGLHFLDFASHQRETVALRKMEVRYNFTPLSWSPNGEFIAFAATQNRTFREDLDAVYLLRTKNRALVRLVDGPLASDSPISWSPDGAWISVCPVARSTEGVTHIIEVADKIT